MDGRHHPSAYSTAADSQPASSSASFRYSGSPSSIPERSITAANVRPKSPTKLRKKAPTGKVDLGGISETKTSSERVEGVERVERQGRWSGLFGSDDDHGNDSGKPEMRGHEERGRGEVACGMEHGRGVGSQVDTERDFFARAQRGSPLRPLETPPTVEDKRSSPAELVFPMGSDAGKLGNDLFPHDRELSQSVSSRGKMIDDTLENRRMRIVSTPPAPQYRNGAAGNPELNPSPSPSPSPTPSPHPRSWTKLSAAAFMDRPLSFVDYISPKPALHILSPDPNCSPTETRTTSRPASTSRSEARPSIHRRASGDALSRPYRSHDPSTASSSSPFLAQYPDSHDRSQHPKSRDPFTLFPDGVHFASGVATAFGRGLSPSSTSPLPSSRPPKNLKRAKSFTAGATRSSEFSHFLGRATSRSRKESERRASDFSDASRAFGDGSGGGSGGRPHPPPWAQASGSASAASRSGSLTPERISFRSGPPSRSGSQVDLPSSGAYGPSAGPSRLPVNVSDSGTGQGDEFGWRKTSFTTPGQEPKDGGKGKAAESADDIPHRTQHSSGDETVDVRSPQKSRSGPSLLGVVGAPVEVEQPPDPPEKKKKPGFLSRRSTFSLFRKGSGGSITASEVALASSRRPSTANGGLSDSSVIPSSNDDHHQTTSRSSELPAPDGFEAISYDSLPVMQSAEQDGPLETPRPGPPQLPHIPSLENIRLSLHLDRSPLASSIPFSSSPRASISSLAKEEVGQTSPLPSPPKPSFWARPRSRSVDKGKDKDKDTHDQQSHGTSSAIVRAASPLGSSSLRPKSVILSTNSKGASVSFADLGSGTPRRDETDRGSGFLAGAGSNPGRRSSADDRKPHAGDQSPLLHGRDSPVEPRSSSFLSRKRSATIGSPTTDRHVVSPLRTGSSLVENSFDQESEEGDPTSVDTVTTNAPGSRTSMMLAASTVGVGLGFALPAAGMSAISSTLGSGSQVVSSPSLEFPASPSSHAHEGIRDNTAPNRRSSTELQGSAILPRTETGKAHNPRRPGSSSGPSSVPFGAGVLSAVTSVFSRAPNNIITDTAQPVSSPVELPPSGPRTHNSEDRISDPDTPNQSRDEDLVTSPSKSDRARSSSPEKYRTKERSGPASKFAAAGRRLRSRSGPFVIPSPAKISEKFEDGLPQVDQEEKSAAQNLGIVSSSLSPAPRGSSSFGSDRGNTLSTSPNLLHVPNASLSASSSSSRGDSQFRRMSTSSVSSALSIVSSRVSEGDEAVVNTDSTPVQDYFNKGHTLEPVQQNHEQGDDQKQSESAKKKALLTVKEGETPPQYIERLKTSVSRTELAKILASKSDTFHTSALETYIATFDFVDDPLDVALRKMLMELYLPQETQQIDRVMEAFAKRYTECNPKLFTSSDQAYVLAFSLIMLHTDAFNKSNKNKMTKADYTRNTKIDGVPLEILDYFYDNITFSPFVFVEDDMDITGQRTTMPQEQSSGFLAAITPSGGKEKNKLDPYDLIAKGLTHELRSQAVGAAVPWHNPFSFTGTVPFFNSSKLHHEFAQAQTLQIVNRVSKASTSDGLTALGMPGVGSIAISPAYNEQDQVSYIKVTKVGILSRKDDLAEGGKKASSRKWRAWSVILTGSQLVFFKDITWATTLTQQIDESKETANSAADDVLLYPRISSFKPDAVLSLTDSVAIFDSTYQRYPNTFRLLSSSGRQYLFQAQDENDMNQWMAAINYAATFRTAGVRMRGLVRRTSKRSSIPTSPTSPSSSSSRGSKTYQHGSHGRNLSAPTIQVPKASTASSISAASTSSTPRPEGSADDHLPMDLATHIALESRDMETGKPPASVLSNQAVGLPSPAVRKSWGDDGSAEGGTMSPTGMLSSSGEARMAPRSSVIRSKIAELESLIQESKSVLQEDLRIARNLSVLAPFQKTTRDRISDAILPVAKRVRSARQNLAKLVCHREVLARDLLAEERDVQRARQLSLPTLTPTPAIREPQGSPVTLIDPTTPSSVAHGGSNSGRASIDSRVGWRSSFIEEDGGDRSRNVKVKGKGKERSHGGEEEDDLPATDDELDRLRIPVLPTMPRRHTGTGDQLLMGIPEFTGPREEEGPEREIPVVDGEPVLEGKTELSPSRMSSTALNVLAERVLAEDSAAMARMRESALRSPSLALSSPGKQPLSPSFPSVVRKGSYGPPLSDKDDAIVPARIDAAIEEEDIDEEAEDWDRTLAARGKRVSLVTLPVGVSKESLLERLRSTSGSTIQGVSEEDGRMQQAVASSAQPLEAGHGAKHGIHFYF